MSLELIPTPRLRCAENCSAPDGTKTSSSTSSATCDSPAHKGEGDRLCADDLPPSSLRGGIAPRRACSPLRRLGGGALTRRLCRSPFLANRFVWLRGEADGFFGGE